MNAKFMPKMLSLLLISRRALVTLGCLAGLASLPAWAERADRNQPLSFAADAARVEDNQRLNILTGNVEITKGTMVVRSDRVEVRQNPDGTQTATAIGGQDGRRAAVGIDGPPPSRDRRHHGGTADHGDGRRAGAGCCGG